MMSLRFLGVAILGLMALGSGVAGAPAPAVAATLSDADKTAIEKVVHDYLVEHPEVLVEAMGVLRERQQQAENTDRLKALTEHHDALFADAQSPVIGNPQGDVTLVEFFDYACPYCKSVAEDLRTLLQTDGKVRLVLKELPVLGPGSVLAARAALASRAQGLYPAYHDALLAYRGQFTEDSVLGVARTVGLDVNRLKADMAAPEIAAEISATHQLADALAIHGTPGFVAGDDVYPGAMDLAALREVVASLRKK